MDVTLKLDEELSDAARHRAKDEGTSLVTWITNLLKRELVRPERQMANGTLLDLLGDDGNEDVEFTRCKDLPREIDFT